MGNLFLFSRFVFFISLFQLLFCFNFASKRLDSQITVSDTEEEVVVEDLPAPTSSQQLQLPINECLYGIQIFVISVDQGNFICIKNYHTKKIVIVDAGSSNLRFENLSIVMPESLKYIFEDCTISAIIITHLDRDHYSYLTNKKFQEFLKIKSSDPTVICGLFERKDFVIVEKIPVPEKTYGIISGSGSYEIIQKGKTPTGCITEIAKQINDNFGCPNAFTFCLPNKGIEATRSKNACSLVIQLSCAGGNILFTGDATGATFDALAKIPQNQEIFRNINFLIIPHHGSDSEGSGEWLSNIVKESGDHFVGALVSANPMKSKRNKHPRGQAVNIPFGMAAKRISKMLFLFHSKEDGTIHAIRTHRCIYEPALLPGKILWLKLENGLSIFDNEAFEKCDKAPESISPFFIPFTTFWNGEWVSVYSCIKSLTKLADTDHTLTVEDKTNLDKNLQKMLTAHTAPMISANQFETDLSVYYERVIEKIPSEEEKQKNFELLGELLPQFRLPFGESGLKKQAVSHEDCSKLRPPLLSTDGTPSVPPSGPDAAEIATMEREVEELQRSENNLRIIEPQIRDANYHIQDVRGDGNCGFYAILQCLHLDKNYEHVSHGDENWNAAESLRREIFSTDPNLSQMVTDRLNQGNRFLPLGLEALSLVARAQGRPIIVINSTYVEHAAFEDPTAENVNYMFITVKPEGSIETSSSIKFKDVLKSAGENPIVLLYTPNHWKAVIPNPSTESFDKSSD